MIPSATFDIVNLIIQRQEAAVYEKAGRTSALSEYGLVLCGHAAVYRRGRRGRAVYPCGRLTVRHAHHVHHQPRKAFPAQAVIDLISQYDFSHQRRVSFEYIVFKDLNDDLKHADALVRLVRHIPCRVNLIRFHAIPNVPLQTSDMRRIEAFRDRLNAKGVVCTIRASRGEDIFAACGMLSTAKNSTFANHK